MAEIHRQGLTMRNIKGIIALDLDGTLLNSKKELSETNFQAISRAAEAGFEIVPTTGRFFQGMPQSIRNLPFVNYAVTINGAAVVDLRKDYDIYKAEIPWQQAVDIMAWLDTMPVIYDCYMDNGGWMSRHLKEKIDLIVDDSHYRKMLHELRKPVPELKSFLLERKTDVQKIQFFTKEPDVRLQVLSQLPEKFQGIVTSSSHIQNVEINQKFANKGDALMALADYLGIHKKDTIAFGDGLNDLTMIEQAGVGIAMENGCQEVKALAKWVTASCDMDGVAVGIERYCLGKQWEGHLSAEE